MKRRRFQRGRLQRTGALYTLIVALSTICPPASAMAHEGHAALPSTGAAIDGDQLLLSEAARTAIDMQTAKVGLDDLRDVIRLNARIELPWRQRAMVTTLMPGRIAGVRVRPGEIVSAGQELARIESMQLESLQLEMLQADERVKLNGKLLKQRQGLADKGVITGAKLLDTRTELRQQSATLQIAIRKLTAMGLENEILNQVRSSGVPAGWVAIKAPISGVVRHAVARTGEFVQSTEHLFEIVDLSSLWIVGDVLESDVSRVAAGMPVNVTFEELAFTGEIGHVRLKMDETQRTIGVVIPIDNSDQTLRPGMFGRMTIEIGTAKESIVCPVDALVETGRETVVLLRQGVGKYKRRRVQIGLRTRDRVEIKSGLFPGDRVIVVGTQLLAAMFDSTSQERAPPKQLDRNSASQPSGKTGPPSQDHSSPGHQTVIAQATVELPTHKKTFATSAIEGRVTKILVQPGQEVRAGEVLAEIDSLLQRNLQLELMQAEAKLKWTEETAGRQRRLTQQGITPSKDLWKLETDLKNLRQSVASLSRKLSLIGFSTAEINQIGNSDITRDAADSGLSNLPIRSPSDGRIAEFDLVVGQVVESHDRLFEVHDLSTVWTEGYVFDQDAAKIRAGQSVRVTFAADPRLRLRGTVVRLAPTFNSKERVLPIWIELETSEQFLREGMFARAEIAVPVLKKALSSHRSNK